MSHSKVVCGVSRIISFPEESGQINGGATLNSPAWSVIDWDPLLGRVVRGQDLLIPNADGVVARDRYIDRLEVSLPMVFDGNVQNNGVPYTAPTTVAEGLEMNRQSFISVAVNLPASPGTRVLDLTLADGDVVSAAFHCIGFEFVKPPGWDGIARAVWRISVPSGRLT